jgi:DNA-directed RNA polymerase specialized sigma24 family protein
MNDTNSQPDHLRRAIGRWSLAALMLNTMIGASAFGLPSWLVARLGKWSTLAYFVDWQLVQQALEQLPVAYSEVLLLCEVEEMSYQEISATLAIPMGTVMSRLSRARRALRAGVQATQIQKMQMKRIGAESRG